MRGRPALPAGAAHVWGWFWRLNRRRQTGYEANPLTLQEIDTLARLTRIEIRPWEAAALCAMDDAYLAECAETRKRREATTETKADIKATPENVKNFMTIMGRGKKRKKPNG